MNNLQKMIAHVRDFLVQQNERSTLIDAFGGTKCAYRGTDNRMCAVGCLIDDEIYDVNMEFKTVDHLLFTNFPQVGPHIVKTFDLNENEQKQLYEVLDAVQYIHDDHEIINWEKSFNKLIGDYSDDRN